MILSNWQWLNTTHPHAQWVSVVNVPVVVS